MLGSLLWPLRRSLRKHRSTIILIGLPLIGAMLLSASLLVDLNHQVETAPIVRELSPVPDARGKNETRMNAAFIEERRALPGNDLTTLPELFLKPPHRSIDGTSLAVDGDVLRLSNIVGPGPEEVCFDAGSRRWSCGLQARAALHNTLVGKTLLCRPQRSLGQAGMTVSCKLGSQDALNGPGDADLARILVGLGWARPDAASAEAFQSEVDKARQAGAGLWRGGWKIVTDNVPRP